MTTEVLQLAVCNWQFDGHQCWIVMWFDTVFSFMEWLQSLSVTGSCIIMFTFGQLQLSCTTDVCSEFPWFLPIDTWGKHKAFYTFFWPKTMILWLILSVFHNCYSYVPCHICIICLNPFIQVGEAKTIYCIMSLSFFHNSSHNFPPKLDIVVA